MFLCLGNSRWNVEGHMKEYAKVVEMVTPYPFFFISRVCWPLQIQIQLVLSIC
jgi:hypothetical protein